MFEYDDLVFPKYRKDLEEEHLKVKLVREKFSFRKLNHMIKLR